MTDPKPKWHDGVPWCNGGCPCAGTAGGPMRVSECQIDGRMVLLGIDDEPGTTCFPAIRRLVEAARRVSMAVYTENIAHGKIVSDAMYDLDAALPPEDGPGTL